MKSTIMLAVLVLEPSTLRVLLVVLSPKNPARLCFAYFFRSAMFERVRVI